MEFDDLWVGSRSFRAIFRQNGVTDEGQARRLWAGRWPPLKWVLCGTASCTRITEVRDGFCRYHSVGEQKRLPKWLWQGGRLYRFLSIRLFHAGQYRGREYLDYARHVMARNHGPLMAGFDVHFIDGNPLNCDKGNLVPISHVSRPALQAGLLRLETAIEIDRRIPDVVNGQGHRPRSISVVSYGDVARATGLTPSGIRSAASRGVFTMDDPASMFAFVLNHQH